MSQQVVSKHTRVKQASITSIMNAVVAWFKLFGTGRFVYIDMNANVGRLVDDAGEFNGSPLIFGEAAVRHGISSLAVLFENVRGRYKQLVGNVLPRLTLQNIVMPVFGDSAKLLPWLKELSKAACGLCYVDPCGSGIAFDVLAAAIQGKIDVLIHVDGQQFLRTAGQWKKPPFAEQFKQVQALKAHWYIAPPVTEVEHTWAIVYGTNNRDKNLTFHELQLLGFVRLDSDLGQQYYHDAFDNKKQRPSSRAVMAKPRPRPPVSVKQQKTTSKLTGKLRAAELAGQLPKATVLAIVKAAKAGQSGPVIMRKFDISRWTLQRVKHAFGLVRPYPRNSKAEKRAGPAQATAKSRFSGRLSLSKMKERDKLIVEMRQRGEKTDDVIDKLDVSKATVSRATRGMGLGRSNQGEGRVAARVNADRERICKRLLVAPIGVVAREIGVSEATLRRAFPVVKLGRQREQRCRDEQAKQIVKLHLQGMFGREICNKLKVSTHTVTRAIRQHGRGGS